MVMFDGFGLLRSGARSMGLRTPAIASRSRMTSEPTTLVSERDGAAGRDRTFKILSYPRRRESRMLRSPVLPPARRHSMPLAEFSSALSYLAKEVF
jgi:hypothetical protein